MNTNKTQIISLTILIICSITVLLLYFTNKSTLGDLILPIIFIIFGYSGVLYLFIKKNES